MPKEPKKKTGLWLLIEATGLSQREFSKLVGISVSMLGQMARGEKKVPPEVARRIRAATGCIVSENVSPKGKLQVDVRAEVWDPPRGCNYIGIDGPTRPYQADDFQKYRELSKSPPEFLKERFIGGLPAALRVILEAAQRGRKFMGVAHDLEQDLAAVVTRYGLAPYLDGWVADHLGSEGRNEIGAGEKMAESPSELGLRVQRCEERAAKGD